MIDLKKGADLGSAPLDNIENNSDLISYTAQDRNFNNSKKQADELEKAFAEKQQTEEPLPLQRENLPPRPFPVWALGPVLFDAVQKVIEVVKAPDSICAGSFLASAALCVQGHRNVAIDSRLIPLSGYFLSVAVSGDRKSSVDKLALRAIRIYEEEVLKLEFDAEMVKYRNLHQAWLARRKQILRLCSDEMESQLTSDPEPKLPLEPVIKCEEPSIEGLQRLFHLGRASQGLFSDEGARFFGGFSMNQENSIKTIACLSKLWDADGPITRIRCEERIQLYGKRLSVHFMVQPSVFRKIIGIPIVRDQGILARFLIAFPEQVGGLPFYEKEDLTQSRALQAFWSKSSEILDTPFPLKKETQNELHPRPLGLSLEAQNKWERFYSEVESELHATGRYYPIYSFAKKAGEHALRLAGILEAFADLNAIQIAKETMQRAIAILNWYLDEALRILGVAEQDEELELAQKVYDFLKKRRVRSFNLRDIYREGPPRVRNKKKAQQMVGILLEHGWIRPVPGKNNLWEPVTVATCDNQSNHTIAN